MAFMHWSRLPRNMNGYFEVASKGHNHGDHGDHGHGSNSGEQGVEQGEDTVIYSASTTDCGATA